MCINKLNLVKNFSIIGSAHNQIEITKVTQLLKEYCETVDLRRFDENNEIVELSYLIQINNIENLNNLKLELKKLDNDLIISFMETKTIF